ncbi:organic cation transporter protein-like [Lineus longissimus]|uniref:organic cation transporter protein-like n=1 Tax=Lineus longissimus TaxID=88925 RepID=UPI002B4CE089
MATEKEKKGKRSFDDVLCMVGEFGPFQRWLYFFIGLTGIPTGCQNIAMVFLGGDQDHWCNVPGLSPANFTSARYREIAIPMETNGYSRCKHFNIAFQNLTSDELASWNRTLMISNLTETVTCSAGWIFDQSQYLTTVQSWFTTVCDQSFLTPLVSTIYMAGFLVGCVVYGALSDAIGRKKTIIGCLVLEVAFGVSAAFSPNYAVFCVLRFFVGTSAAGSFTTAFVIVMEIIGPNYRMAPGIFVQGWFALGFLILTVVAFFIRDQWLLQLVLVSPVIILPVIYAVVCPESPRWLVSKGRYVEAQMILKSIAKTNGRKLPKGFNLEEELDIPTVDENASKPSIVDLVKTPRMRVRSLNIFFNWFVNSFVYYGLSLNGGALGDVYINSAISAAVEFPAYVFCILILDRIGRRLPLAGTMIVGGAACLGFIPILQNENLSAVRTALSILGKFGITCSFAIIYNYSAEVFPTVIRNVGVGTGSMHARIGGVLAPQVALLTSVWFGLPSLLFGVTSVLAGTLAFLLPETLHQELPETIEDGERFGSKYYKPKDSETGVANMGMDDVTDDTINTTNDANDGNPGTSTEKLTDN